MQINRRKLRAYVLKKTSSPRFAAEKTRDAKNAAPKDADLDIFPEDGFIRMTVIDHRSKPASTNAYFTDDLGV